jgi:3-phenylpropionate/trans-cinnamate dioxygenase ferredoxin subunit
MADEVKVTVFDDGPYELVGPITITDESGNKIEFAAGEPVYLCRCGGSTDKPFCDGTHSKIGFQGANAAVKASEG